MVVKSALTVCFASSKYLLLRTKTYKAIFSTIVVNGG